MRGRNSFFDAAEGVTAYVRGLRPQLPAEAWIVEAGGLTSAVGNGVILPFAILYLHNVRGFPVGVAALVIACLNGLAIFTTPFAGGLIDRFGARLVLAAALVLLAAGYGLFPLVHHPWQAFVAATVAAIGNGGMAPAYVTLLANVTPREQRHTAFALRRISDNLGVAIGAAIGGVVAGVFATKGYEALFVADAATFIIFAAVIPAVRPQRQTPASDTGSYRDVLRNPLVVRLFLLNVLLVAAGYGTINTILPLFVRNDVGLGTAWVGVVFVCNMLAVVILQLPISQMLEGRRRMPAIAVQGALWAFAWLLVFVAGFASPLAVAGIVIALAATLFGAGEAVSGAIHRPLFTDLAPMGMLGRYSALFDASLRLGLTLGPALGGVIFTETRREYWLLAAAICLAAGLGSWALEPLVPAASRLTPRRAAPLAAEPR